jgi:choline monooxygenase
MNRQTDLTPGLERFRLGHYPAVMQGLPREAYLDDTWFRREQERIFARRWVFVAYAHEFATPGELKPVTVAGQPVLLIKGRDGALRAFHNVCSHRGAKLVEHDCAGKRNIVCPYHAWCYDLEGRLTAAPHFGGYRKEAPDFDKSTHGLKPVALAVLHDWIFVNLDGKAGPFADYAAPLEEAMAGLDFSRLRPVAKIDLGVVEANWKFLMENFIEPYHVPIVHHSTTEQPLSDHYNIANGPCLGSAVDIAKPKDGERTDTLAVSSRYLTLFPTFVLGVYAPDQAGVHLNVPLSPGRTRQYRVIYQFAGERWSETQAADLRRLWYRVHKEDHAIVERLQAGRQSGATADGGVLSPYWETSLYEFQRLVRESME